MIATRDEGRKGLWQTARLIDAQSGRTLHELTAAGTSNWLAEFSRDSSQVIVGGASDGRIWTVPGGRLLRSLAAPSSWFTPDGTHVALSVGSEVTVWDVATATPVRRLGAVQPIDGFTLDADGSRAASIDPQGSVYVWDTRTMRLLARYPFRIGHQWKRVAFSDTGALAIASIDGSVALRSNLKAEPMTLSPRAAQDGPAASGVAAIAFSPDGTRLAVGQADGSAAIWRVGMAPCRSSSQGRRSSTTWNTAPTAVRS